MFLNIIKKLMQKQALYTKSCTSFSKCNFIVWRRRRDSNPRASFPAYALSRGASSTCLSTSPCTKHPVANVDYSVEQKKGLWLAALKVHRTFIHFRGYFESRSSFFILLAEKEGFEPSALASHRFSRPAP